MATFEYTIDKIKEKIAEDGSSALVYICIYFPVLGQLLCLNCDKKLYSLVVPTKGKK